MRNGLAICLSVIVTLSFASSAWSQNPITADSPFQVRYFSNLNLADSVINITNSGAQGMEPGGNICANVYVFFQDFGLVSYTKEGKERWQVPLGPFNSFFGMAASPILVGDTLVLPCDQDTHSFMVGVHKDTGKLRLARGTQTRVVQL